MKLNLKNEAFSIFGSYFAFSIINDNLYFRRVSGGISGNNLLRLNPMYDGEILPYTVDAEPGILKMITDKGNVEITFFDNHTVLFKGDVGLKMTCEVPSSYANHFKYDNQDMYHLNFKFMRVMACAHKGNITVDYNRGIDRASYKGITITLSPDFEFIVEEIIAEWDKKHYRFDFQESVKRNQDNFKNYFDKIPTMDSGLDAQRELYAYTTWLSVVEPRGLLKRNTMYMSKNKMCSVWSWDNCFNAISTSYFDPELSWNQFMCLFDLQDKSGVIPDFANDAYLTWANCKPPIHGWALKMIMKNIDLTLDQLNEAYNVLSKWTNWWYCYRDFDGDGICQYFHGNDCGWDNSTVFDQTQDVASPDLQAFLIVSQEVLSEVAEKIGKHDEAEMWKQKADDATKKMVDYCFIDNKPVARNAFTHEVIENKSLLPYMAVFVADRLPKEIRDSLVDTLKGDAFTTEYGLATEMPDSECYTPDGYWRGPIWAPYTLLLVDALTKIGETKLADDLSSKFIKLVKKSGFAENYDALTGEGLRDTAFTWTASTFLTLTQYLKH